jgi:methionyl-tRNA formyltransferase
MKVLLLSSHQERLTPILRRHVTQVHVSTDRLTTQFLQHEAFDLGISFGYRHIIKQEHLDLLRFINIHISYLPWNRGADPNLWSWIDDTPKGVTIHEIDAGIDTGNILAQKIVPMTSNETLKSSYQKLMDEAFDLFEASWPTIFSNKLTGIPQKGAGSSHSLKDGKLIFASLQLGYDTPVSQLRSLSNR